ncbi:hypothetical protein BH11CYA1_BH11CYA1_23800 [soil metagenome]
MSAIEDHILDAVPLSERRGPVTMTLLWITMVTAFPTVLIGFQWFKCGLTLGQVLICSIISCIFLLIYSVPAAWLGVRSGLTYSVLTRQIFGRYGTWLVSFHAIWLMSAWYAIDAVLCADALRGLFHINWPVPLFAACLSMLMAVNNFFGFKGVANFARYFAAPLLVLWVAYTFCKVIPTVPLEVLTATTVPGHPPISFMSAMTLVSSFVIGFAVWGNEPDYWRYSKPNKKFVIYSLIAALFVGEIIFPATGWMVARLSQITDYIEATNFMNNYSFGGVAVFAALVLIANYCAANDSNMYGMINALENLKRLPHKLAVILLAGASSAFAAWLAMEGSSKSLESIASLNCVIIPVMTVIMIVEEFVIKPRFNLPDNSSVVVPMNELPAIRWPAFIASHIGLFVGICTAGVVPGLEWLFLGICSVQSWLVAAVVYYVMRVAEIKLETNKEAIGT